MRRHEYIQHPGEENERRSSFLRVPSLLGLDRVQRRALLDVLVLVLLVPSRRTPVVLDR